MPLRTKPSMQPPIIGTYRDEYYRSKAAEQSPDRHPEVKDSRKRQMMPIDYGLVTVPPSLYKDPLDNKDDSNEDGNNNNNNINNATASPQHIRHHTEWLDHFQSWCDAHQRLDHLPRGWHAALSEAHRQLSQARRDPAHTRGNTWTPSFDFQVPPYDDRWQSWDLVAAGDGTGEMRPVLRDVPAPRACRGCRSASTWTSRPAPSSPRTSRGCRCRTVRLLRSGGTARRTMRGSWSRGVIALMMFTK